MTARIFAYIRPTSGDVVDIAAELATAARKIDSSSTVTAIAAGFGTEFDKACGSLRTIYQEVWKISNPAFEHTTPELLHKALAPVIPAASFILFSHDHFGIDVAPGLSIALNSTYVSDIVGIDRLAGTTLHVVCQEFGGQFNTHVSCDVSSGVVITVRPGAFKSASVAPISGTIVDVPVECGILKLRRRFVGSVSAPAGDVDISKQEVLVSVGRGIQKLENMVLAEDLARALGAAVSCSRPVVDAKWLDKSRQVGSSGKYVKPKVYLACGISGQFQHLAGLKGSPFIIAINKNPTAPIFKVADVGVVADILEFLPELTHKVRDSQHDKCIVSAK
jgi:electron transfer flavoprotein alpha subunit